MSRSTKSRTGWTELLSRIRIWVMALDQPVIPDAASLPPTAKTDESQQKNDDPFYFAFGRFGHW